jgi:carbon monoxide dehydrogenase subunit G
MRRRARPPVSVGVTVQFFDSFSAPAQIDDVFAVVADAERLVACVPGAKVLERRGEDVYEVALKVRLGPMWKRYGGTITVVEREADAHRVEMTIGARDAGGDPVGDATIRIGLAGLGSSTTVSIDSQVTVAAGEFAETAIKEASAKQISEFTANLRTMVSGAPRP